MAPRPNLGPSRQDLLAGAVFAVLGAGFALGALQYDLGTPAEMAPGSFPFVLGVLLGLFGIITILKAFLAGEREPIGSVPWRAILLILGAIVFFGATVRGLGLVPAIFVAALLASFASERAKAHHAVAIAAGLTVLSVVIFVVALQLRLSLVGPWLGGF